MTGTVLAMTIDNNMIAYLLIGGFQFINAVDALRVPDTILIAAFPPFAVVFTGLILACVL